VPNWPHQAGKQGKVPVKMAIREKNLQSADRFLNAAYWPQQQQNSQIIADKECNKHLVSVSPCRNMADNRNSLVLATPLD
jgi:hypothetical protein